MPGLESFSTASLALHTRLDYWNALHAKAIVPTCTDASDLASFAPGMARTTLGGLWVAQMTSSASVVHHAREHVSTTQEAMFFLKIQLSGGSSRVSQDGREVSLQVGDFALIDSTRPYHMTFDAPNKMLVFGIPDALLRRQLAHPERLVAMRMSYNENLNSILSDFALRLWHQCELNVADAGSNLASALLNLTAAAYDKLADAQAIGSAHLEALRLRIMHGRLPTDDKDAAMRAFADGSADVLVSTTVVEVGVDVPNATVMVIMDADRFGVSQLHQLRGRVGRGTEPGLCLLVTEAPEGTKARQRLADVAATVDGFRLAEIDLEQRREGDVLGATQAGRKKSLKLLSVLRDRELIVTARGEATELVDADPDLAGHPALAAEMSALLDEEQAGFLEKA